MKKYILQLAVAGTLLTVSSLAISAGGLSKKEYAAKYKLHGSGSSHWEQVKQCIASFPTHPFKNSKKVRFRVIEPSVKVFGIGKNVIDEVTTDYPQLILIRPAVSIMSRSSYMLMNPNGWYCFSSKVNVMGKMTIKTACKTHLTTTRGNTTVFGESDGEQAGTTVMGKTVIEKSCT